MSSRFKLLARRLKKMKYFVDNHVRDLHKSWLIRSCIPFIWRVSVLVSFSSFLNFLFTRFLPPAMTKKYGSTLTISLHNRRFFGARVGFVVCMCEARGGPLK